MDIFSFNSYKEFIKKQINDNSESRGYQSKLAEAARCQKSYLSHILHSHHHLNPDQACGLALFWDLNNEETDWFLLLVDIERAQSESLKKRLREKLRYIKTAREDLAPRFKKPRIKVSEKEFFYYSSWHWSAIHIITSIPRYQTVEAISEKLGLPKSLVRDCLQNLEEIGLVKASNGRWKNISWRLIYSQRIAS